MAEIPGGKNMIDILDQTEQRSQQAWEILAQLQLFERWQVFGSDQRPT